MINLALGNAAAEKSQHDQAEIFFRRSFEQDSRNADALYNLVCALVAQKKYDVAIASSYKYLSCCENDQRGWLNHGVILSNLGSLEDASIAFKKSIALDSGNSLNAKYNLAYCLFLKEDYQEAILISREIIKLDPRLIEARLLRARIYKTLGALSESAIDYLEVLKLNPLEVVFEELLVTLRLITLRDHREEIAKYLSSNRNSWPKLLGSLWKVFYELGDYKSALDYIDKFSKKSDEMVSVRLARADILLRMGLFTESISQSNKILEDYPHNVAALVNKGLAHQCLGNLEDALLCNKRAIEISEHVPELWNNYGLSLAATNRREEAYLAYRRALILNPNYDNVVNNIGILLIEDGRNNDAINLFRDYIDRGVANKAVYFNMGNALTNIGRDEEAINFFDQAIYLDEDYVDALLNKSFALLRLCNYKDGWAFYEARLKKYDGRLITSSSMPFWDGSKRLGNRLLIYAEQGFGDTIQFCRLLPDLIEQGYEVSFEVQPQLVGILQTLDSRITLVERGKPLPIHDYSCPLLSLCRIFTIDLRFYGKASSYLSVDRRKSLESANRPKGLNRMKIGIVWRGSPTHSNDQNRSIQLTRIQRIFSNKFEWISLQYDPSKEEKGILRESGVSDLSSEISDFSDTALIIDKLDLVVCVDTSVAHLAGALGKRVWMMVAFKADFRWAPEVNSSPWYPSLKIFRQSSPGDWEEPLNEIIRGLEKYTHDNTFRRS